MAAQWGGGASSGGVGSGWVRVWRVHRGVQKWVSGVVGGGTGPHGTLKGPIAVLALAGKVELCDSKHRTQ